MATTLDDTPTDDDKVDDKEVEGDRAPNGACVGGGTEAAEVEVKVTVEPVLKAAWR